MSGESRAAGLVLTGVFSVQAGAALATTLFDEVGPAGTVLLRTLFAAIVLLAAWRPTLRGHGRSRLELAALFGAALAGMNLCFYEALDRLPLGIAVTLEFTGPLTVAVLGSRRRLDLLWVALAAAGIVLLSGGLGGKGVDAVGAILALGAGALWGAYILISARVGREFEGGTGLALAMAFSAILLIPPGVVAGAEDLVAPGVIAAGLGVALLSSVIPYSVELEALRRLPPGTFGVLMSLEPAVAALVGLIAIGQDLSAVEVAAIGLVVAASAGALRSAAAPPRDA
ncbi:MAG TPA: EamA family transporter [Solirubrobacterales bacterium]|nr:EamA family transporter [Solirubrobacterales bacterium]